MFSEMVSLLITLQSPRAWGWIAWARVLAGEAEAEPTGVGVD